MGHVTLSGCMTRFAYRFGMPAVVGLLALAGGLAVAAKTPTIKEIMAKLHRGPRCLRTVIARDLKAADPDWGEIEKETREFVKLVGELRKKSPPVGTKESWEQLTQVFLDNAKAMASAAQKHDKPAALRAHARMGNCKTCHDAHKPK